MAASPNAPQDAKRLSAIAELESRYAAPSAGSSSSPSAKPGVKTSAKKGSDKKRKQREVAEEVDPADPLYQRIDLTDAPQPPPGDAQAVQIVAALVESVAGPGAARGRQFETAVATKLTETSTLLLDNPKEEQTIQSLRKKRAAEQAQRSKRVSAMKQRKLQVYDIPEDARKYELYLPLHELWKKYIAEILGGGPPTGTPALNSLLKADFHGGHIRVVRSKCPSLVGVQGIVLQETENTFRIITPADRLVVVPKVASVFAVRIDPAHEALLYGLHLRHRTAERSVKKFKNKVTIDL